MAMIATDWSFKWKFSKTLKSITLGVQLKGSKVTAHVSLKKKKKESPAPTSYSRTLIRHQNKQRLFRLV